MLLRSQRAFMTTIRFLTPDLDLELSGSEAFVSRQLLLLSPYLSGVDPKVLRAADAAAEPGAPDAAVPEADAEDDDGAAAAHGNGAVPEEGFAAALEPPPEAMDGLEAFFRKHEPTGRDRQADAALLFAYYLQTHEGASALRLGDLIRCCIRAGVDTRNFNRTLGALTRRGLFTTLRHGHAYRLSEQGVAAVEQRL